MVLLVLTQLVEEGNNSGCRRGITPENTHNSFETSFSGEIKSLIAHFGTTSAESLIGEDQGISWENL